MYSFVSLMGLVTRRARGTGGTKIIVANVDIGCGHTTGVVCYLVKTADCLSGGDNPNVADERNGLLHLRKGWWASLVICAEWCSQQL